MCGIVGIIGGTNNEALMQMALDSLQARGPDDRGMYHEGPLWLGHTRLSIQDCSHLGHQPMISKEGQFVLIFNGEIYNHAELRQSLAQKGYLFQSQSDSETLLYAYQYYGAAVLPLLNGIFAFSIYDRQAQKVFIARDSFGFKPLYYKCSEQQFIWSSQIKTIAALSAKTNAINYNSLFQSLVLQWPLGPDCSMEGVHQLPPGHYLELDLQDPQSYTIQQWASAPFEGQYQNDEESIWVDRLEAALLQAVQRQLLSDRPIGFFLSGGLDSSLLMAMANKLAPLKAQQAFTIDPGPEFQKEGYSDDLSYAKKVALHLNIELETISLKANLIDQVDEMIGDLEEVQADFAALFVKAIAKSAKTKGFDVLISGLGADDIFSGYRRHQAIVADHKLDAIPISLRRVMKQLIALLPERHVFRRLKKLDRYIDKKHVERMFAYFYWADPNWVLQLFSQKAQTQIDPKQIARHFEKLLEAIPQEQNRLNQMLYLEMQSFLPNHNLSYTDKMGMAASVEIRVPYLDNDVVRLAAMIPPELKMRGATTKYLLKKVAERYLPHDVVYRTKTGFGAPLRTWMQEDPVFQNKVKTSLLKLSLIAPELFEEKALMRIFQSTISKDKDFSYTLFTLVCIESWIRQFGSKPNNISTS